MHANEYENIGVVVENPEVFNNIFLGEFVIKTAVNIKTNNLELILRAFAQLSALVVSMSNIAMLRFAILKDGQWISKYVLPGYDKSVLITLEVPVDIQTVIYGTKQIKSIIKKEYSKGSSKLAKVAMIVKILTKLVPDKMTEQELMKQIYTWIQTN